MSRFFQNRLVAGLASQLPPKLAQAQANPAALLEGARRSSHLRDEEEVRRPTVLRNEERVRRPTTREDDDMRRLVESASDEERRRPIARVRDEPPPARGHPQAAQNSLTEEEIRINLKNLVDNAKMERLEFAVPLIETLQFSLAVDRASNGALPGTLTVKGWFGLLNRWEKQLAGIRQRQIFCSKPFFLDALAKVEEFQSPLAPAFHELLELMERALEVK